MSLTQPTLKLDLNIEAPFIKVVQECIIKSTLTFPCLLYSFQKSQKVHRERSESDSK